MTSRNTLLRRHIILFGLSYSRLCLLINTESLAPFANPKSSQNSRASQSTISPCSGPCLSMHHHTFPSCMLISRCSCAIVVALTCLAPRSPILPLMADDLLICPAARLDGWNRIRLGRCSSTRHTGKIRPRCAREVLLLDSRLLRSTGLWHWDLLS